MTGSQSHEMELIATHPSGAEEWFCPTCGRRVLMRWPPAYEKVLLEAGDEAAIHSGAKGGLRMSPPQIDETAEESGLSEELRAALEQTLENVDLDDSPSAADS